MVKNIAIVLSAMAVSLFGTMIGASLGMIIKRPGKRLLSGVMGLSGGLMLAVVVFELIPEGIEMLGLFQALLYFLLGIILITIIDLFIQEDNYEKNYAQIALVTALGLMIHNLPEGIVMGSGFLIEKNLGIEMSIIIALHDIPEGIAVTAPLMAMRVKPMRILLYSFITAIPTAIGAAIGITIGGISTYALGGSLALASGIMLAVVFFELVPEANKLSGGIIGSLGVIMGITLGLLMVQLL